MNNVLYLDPTNDNLVVFILFKKDKVYKIEKKYQKPLSEVLLLILDELLKKSKTKLDSLECLAIVSGPGSFSSLRVAVILINTLSWSLKIPAVSFRVGEVKKEEDLLKQVKSKIKSKKFKPIIPFYNKEPNITKPKKSFK